MAKVILDFEKPIIEIEKKIAELGEFSNNNDFEINKEIKRLEAKASKLRKETYSKLTRWQRYQLARHPERPYTLDYIERMLTDFIELHGDRNYADDPAMVAGIGKLDDMPVAIVGHQKARETKEKLRRNFGMAHPEGYRKALRVMKLAAKYNRPIITLVDTPGAFPGIGAEERGQGEAIARNLFEMARLPVPILVIIIGEGASGGALGIGVGDRVLMMENTWYSVISPEGCAAILFKDSSKAQQAAESMKITAQDMEKLKLIDGIIEEPLGAAHSDFNKAAAILKKRIKEELTELLKITPSLLIEQRVEKFALMGEYRE